MAGSGLTKIANSRSIMQDSSLNSVNILSSSEEYSSQSFHVEKQKELFYFYRNPKTNKERKIVPTLSTFSFGAALVDCNISSCNVYSKCQQYDYTDEIHMVCIKMINIEDISSKNANKIYVYSKHLIVVTKGENPSIFLYNFSSGEQQIVLNGLMPNERNKSSLAFIAYDIVVSTLGASGKVEIYLISLDKKVQKFLKVFNPNAKCSTDISSTSDGNFSVTLYAKCKGRPPKIITFRSTNLQNFSRENYYPKAAILGNERIKGLCNFRKGIIFVTADSVFFFNKKNNFFIKSNPLQLGSEDYEVKCLNGGLLGFYTNTFITVFNFDDFYDIRFRNSARYDVRNT